LQVTSEIRTGRIPKPGGSGKLRRLGIPTVADRVVQATLKLVLEPIFEADFQPVSYGFRPKRRAHTLWPRSTTSAPWVTGGFWKRISRRALTPSATRP